MLGLVFFSSQVFAFNVSHYEYQMNVLPLCSEYMGHVKFELPVEFGAIDRPNLYSEDKIFVDSGMGGSRLDRNRDWYVNSVPGYSVNEVENLFDGNFNSDFIGGDSG